ncbi:FtsX-like permease family protein [Pseudonocardia sp. MH-G8]|uniref:FtsX-like permease family protein n=1 Tax=Pseudonocardia sp. MH-G8 TaxID=1854588 RepID=UPI000BA053EE|nr:FtsX-like permease family protein [Pseudonocardia sp. MH-G8]OZM82596.1 ABC transporter permease [Pseudonocardia sp. MH-G8]
MNVATAALSLRLLRLGGRRAAASAALIGIGITVGTALLAVALGAVHGWDAREARAGWRTEQPVRASGAPVAMVGTSTDAAAGRPLQRVDIAGLAPTPPPPGLPRVPGPGEVWVSPALAALLRELPPDALADRFPAPTGEITEAGLVAPDELVAVIGRTPSQVPDAVPVGSFAAGTTGLLELYRQLTYVAAVLLVFPVASLLGASARLTAARRAERLAVLRLLGASTGQVTVAAVTEVAAVAAAAAVLGIGVQWVAAPALAAIELGGAGWFAGDLRPGPATATGLVAGVVVLALLAALGGMREVVVEPLGVVRRQRPGTARLLRLLGVAGGIGVFAVANGARQVGPADVAGLVFGVGVLALFGTVSLIGPLVVRLLGNRMTRAARSPAALIAGRRLLDDPRGAFRPLSGVTLAVFVAGFLSPLTATLSASTFGDDTALRIVAPAGAVGELQAEVRDRLAARGIAAEVVIAGIDAEVGIAVTPTLPADRDRVRTALEPVAAGPVLTEREAQSEDAVFVADLQRGAFVVLAGTFLIAATATGTAAAGRVLDHRRTLRSLRLAGTPISVLDSARRAETVRPLLVLAAIALALGLLCAFPFAAATSALEPAGIVLLGASLVAGVAVVAAASAASRPLLRAVTGTPVRDD